MDLASSSLYAGCTALDDEVNVSHGQTKRRKIVVSKTVHPEYREVSRSYGKGFHLEVVEIDMKDGMTDLRQLEEVVDEETASVVVQYPNFLGQIEPLDE